MVGEEGRNKDQRVLGWGNIARMVVDGKQRLQGYWI